MDFFIDVEIIVLYPKPEKNTAFYDQTHWKQQKHWTIKPVQIESMKQQGNGQ